MDIPVMAGQDILLIRNIRGIMRHLLLFINCVGGQSLRLMN